MRLHDAIVRRFGPRAAPELVPELVPDLEPPPPPLDLREYLVSDPTSASAMSLQQPEPPRAMPQTPPPPPRAKPTGEARLVPARDGGVVLVVDGVLAAVGRTPAEIGRMASDWASGAYL